MCGLIPACKKQFQYTELEDFIFCQWQKSKTVTLRYLIYRFVLLGIFLMIFMTGFTVTSHIPRQVWFRSMAYLTNWTFFMCELSCVLGFVIVLLAYLKYIETDETELLRKPTLFFVFWIVHGLASDASVTVSVGYYSYLIIFPKAFTNVHTWGVVYHFIFTLLILIDGQVVRFKVQLCHAFITAIYGIIYSLFTIIYYASGGKSLLGEDSLYPLLNWREKPGIALAVCFGAIVFGALARVLTYLLYKFRIFIHRKVVKPKNVHGNISVEKSENVGSLPTEESTNKVARDKSKIVKLDSKTSDMV